MKPQFFILAGPNGAGKSTYGQEHVPPGTHIFDGDLVYAELLQKYPHYDPEKLKGGVPARLEIERDKAIANSKDFAFESNYSNDLAIELTETFQKAGHETNLIYFGLPNIEKAALRVDTRVRLGGHNISTEDIRFNFQEGIRRVKENLHRYDRIKFVDTNTEMFAQMIAFYIHETGKVAVLKPNIDWYSVQFHDKMLEVAIQRINEISSGFEKKKAGEQQSERKIAGRTWRTKR